jgi:oligopeptide transport system substrate-binding protein
LVAADIQSELQSNLDGVKINLVTEPKNQRVTDMKNHNYSIGITRWGADYQDATTYLDMWTDNSSYNYGSWHNDRYEELYNLIYGEYATEADKRLSAMIEQESIILGEAAICPLYQKTNCYLLTTDYSFPYSTDRYSYMLQYAVKK